MSRVSRISRRKVLWGTLQVCVGGALVSAVVGKVAAAQCVDLEAMDASEQSTRKGVHWTAMTSNSRQPCSKCEFYKATKRDCGNCAIFNGPTTINGHCDSWSAKSETSQ
jgi:hypothetical protein